MSLIQITPGVPLPTRKRPANARYPFQDLKVGDSFAVPLDVTANAMRATARFHAKKTGWQFKVRLGDQGYRVWRTA